MDDPWGSSPWADEVQLPTITKTQAEAPQSTTPIRAAKLGLEEKTNSPWGDNEDNDGFGDWAALPGDQEQALGLDGATDDDNWGQHLADVGDLSITKSTTSSKGWEARDTLDSEEPSNPVLGAVAPTIVRQPSPDPWALEMQFGEEDSEEPQDEDLQPGHKNDTATNVELDKPEPAVPKALQSSIETLVPNSDHKHEETSMIEDVSAELITQESNTGEDEENVLEGEPRSENQDSDPASRPSSSPSERSHHDELSQESPRTSFDEEPKHKRPQIPRKVSTKVHELVEHFDTLAKEDIEPSTTRTSSAEVAKVGDFEEAGHKTDEEDDFGDFGDFEEGQSDDEEPETKDSQSVDRAVIEDKSNRLAQHQVYSSLESALTKDYGIVEYNLDASSLDSIFPDTTPNATSEAIFIPDSLPADSFSSTGQRKTWYRISRYGTMRKHNNGNDENYVRAGWKPSSIRDDTLKIVSRWIEEDRISGRVVLGGGSKGSTVFGWNDPKAPAVPLSDVFVKHGKKMSNTSTTAEQASEVPREWPKGLTRERSSSKARASSSKPRRTSSVKSVSAPAPSDIRSGPVIPLANFGWNLGSVANANISSLSSEKRSSLVGAPPKPLSKPEPPHSKSISPHMSTLSVLPLSRDALSHEPTVPATKDQSSLPIEQERSPLPNLTMSTVFSDDDDWGEMVSTPATPTLSVIPPLKPLRHKKSQSFGGSTATHNQGLASQMWKNDMPETSHRSRSSFDATFNSQAAVPNFGSQHTISSVDLNTAFTTQTAPSKGPSQMQSESSSAPSDPWASADFSFFETAPAPSLLPVASLGSKTAVPKGVRFNPPSPPRRNQMSKEELEQDRIVQTVVKGLPDLSYMLRK